MNHTIFSSHFVCACVCGFFFLETDIDLSELFEFLFSFIHSLLKFTGKTIRVIAAKKKTINKLKSLFKLSLSANTHVIQSKKMNLSETVSIPWNPIMIWQKIKRILMFFFPFNFRYYRSFFFSAAINAVDDFTQKKKTDKQFIIFYSLDKTHFIWFVYLLLILICNCIHWSCFF